MTTQPPSHVAPPVFGSPSLRSAEWMAENAYIAPGFHRLLTAGGLTLGLLGGRRLMDIITARSAADNQDQWQEDTPEILRPIHGIMRYNPYSDAAADRWKFVIDRMVPVALGAVAVYGGGKLFFNRKMPSGEPFSAASISATKQWAAKNISTEIADMMLGLRRSDSLRKWAAATFVEGGSAGMHLFGALWPFNNGLIAESFRQGAGRNIAFPFSTKLNRWLGTNGTTSRNLYAAARETTKWIESNVLQFKDAKQWVQRDLLLRRAKDGLQKFPQHTVKQENDLADALGEIIRESYDHAAKLKAGGLNDDNIRHELNRFISGHAKGRHNRGLAGNAYDHLLHSIGIDLRDLKFARDPFAFFSRLFGSRPHERRIIRTYADYLKKEFYPTLDTEQWAADQLRMRPWKVAAAYSSGAAAIAAGLAGAGVSAHRIYKESSHTHKPHLYETDDSSADLGLQTAVNPASRQSSGVLDWVNGKPLDVAHWIGRVVVNPPSMHRFMNAAYLSLVLYGGMKFSNLLTGRRLTKIMSGGLSEAGISESIIPRNDVFAPLRFLHGIISYTPGSADTTDRWRQALHYIIPVGMGMFGTYAGSHLYFRDREKSLQSPKNLEDYADRIAFEQSKIYAAATAITSIFNTGSGIHLLPVVNYSANLHNRFLMASGDQVAMPGLGRWWSGNAGLTPWGIKRTLQFTARYLTHNDSAFPRELPSLVHAVIGKLYPDMSETDLLDKKQIMLDRIHDVRASYLRDGAIHPDKRAALGQAMQTLLSGAGFESLLREAGLDPAKADLAANGASGYIANILGKRCKIEKLKEEYKNNFAERQVRNPPVNPGEFLRGLLDKSVSGGNHAVQKRPAQFAERIQAAPQTNFASAAL